MRFTGAHALVSDQWRNVDPQAAARETLPLSSLFFAIDVCVRG
ncbi:MAG TPA: hypothetical protein VFD07_04670 [Candidatus Krumholzibacteria bacterium]|nr:hypothetical protein [Candidatus Krumholzibacteria bacterium]